MGCHGLVTQVVDRPAASLSPETDGQLTLRVGKLTKYYGDHPALTEVSFTVRRGEVFGYLGPNGAGKTTTLRLLMGFLRPTAGQAEILGSSCWSDPAEVHRRVGYVSGDVALYDRMTGAELLRYLASLRGGVDWSYVADLAQQLEVELDRPLKVLSTGNRQKVAIVQALMSRPDLLLLDEPTRGLDPLGQQRVHDLLRAQVAGGGSVLLSSHVLSEVQQVADRIGILRDGKLVGVERLDDLRAKSLHRLEARFDDPVDASEFRLPGVRDVRIEAGVLTCSASRSALDALLKAVAAHRIVDLECEEASLEDMFLAYYGRGDRDVA